MKARGAAIRERRPRISLRSMRATRKKKGCPRGQPFHCQAAIRRLSARSAGRRRDRDVNVTRRAPRGRWRSSSWMPATAAMDNETLDHLLSVRCRDLIYKRRNSDSEEARHFARAKGANGRRSTALWRRAKPANMAARPRKSPNGEQETCRMPPAAPCSGQAFSGSCLRGDHDEQWQFAFA